MHFAWVNDEQTGRRGWMIAAAISEFAFARLNQTELIFLVPMPRHGPGDRNAAPQLKLREIGRSPDFNGLRGVCFLLRFLHCASVVKRSINHGISICKSFG